MKRTPPRWVRDLAPLPLGHNREIRLQLVDVNGHKRGSMSTWCKGDMEWHKMPGVVEIPIDLLDELCNRLTAS